MQIEMTTMEGKKAKDEGKTKSERRNSLQEVRAGTMGVD